jgi:hypothetical protein
MTDMAVPVEGFTVVVRNSTIAAKYPGGLEAYERDCPNATFCSDGSLTRIAFMTPGDADEFVALLAAKRLTPYRDGVSEDVALVTSPQGPRRPCNWLELSRLGTDPIVWLAGSDVGTLHAPPGWKPQHTLQWMSAEEAKRRLEFVRSQDNVDVYRDKETGKELYVGRTASGSDADRSRHDDLYNHACALVKGLILIHGQTPKELDQDDRRRLMEAIALFSEVVRINPGNWAAMWLLGKVYQRLSDYEQGLQWFSRAHRVNPDNPDIAREAAIAAMEVGRPEEAVPFCERAIETKPDDPGLRANLAVALLFSGKPAEARKAADEALQRDPMDKITSGIVRIIDQVVAGKRPCPHHMRDLQ